MLHPCPALAPCARVYRNMCNTPFCHGGVVTCARPSCVVPPSAQDVVKDETANPLRLVPLEELGGDEEDSSRRKTWELEL
jgi:hypothetical protein